MKAIICSAGHSGAPPKVAPRNPYPLTEGYGFRAPSLRSGPGMTETSVRVTTLAGRCRGQMRLKEVTHPLDGPGLQFGRVLPGIDRHLGIGRQRCDVDGRLVRVRRGVVGQDEHRRLAIARELARHAVHEVGPGAVKVVQVFLNGFHRDLGPSLAELFSPDN